MFGPPQQCIDTIEAYKASGADYFIVRFASPDQMGQMARFTEEVLPLVALTGCASQTQLWNYLKAVASPGPYRKRGLRGISLYTGRRAKL